MYTLPGNALMATTRASETPPAPTPLWRTVFGVMVNPGRFLQGRLSDVGWAAALGVSGMAFLLFFLQTGLDQARAGLIDADAVAGLAGVGLLYGSLGVATVAVVGWAGARLFGGERPVEEAVKGFGLAYSPTLVYAALGLVFNVFLGWNTAVAFGVTGVLWALGPMTTALKDLVDGHTGPAVVLATVCGMLVLLGWAELGGI